MEPELEILRTPGDDVEIRYLDQGLHMTPKKMAPAIQEQVDLVSGRFHEIVLGYGLCANGIVGVRAGEQGLYAPRSHDCIALFMGSCETYRTAIKKRPGTFYLTAGWIEDRKDPLSYMEDRYVPRMGRETAEWGMKEELKHYSHFVLIDTGAGDLGRLRKRTLENARFFGKAFEEIPGDPTLFGKMLVAPLEDDDFIFIRPGESIRQSQFLDLAGKCSSQTTERGPNPIPLRTSDPVGPDPGESARILPVKPKNTISRYRLTLLPMGILLQGDEGQTIMEVLAGSDIPMRSDCGGQGKCGKCLLSAGPAANLSPPTDVEIRLSEKNEMASTTRLACQARIYGDIIVTLPAWGQAGDPILPKSDATGNYSAAPAVKRIFVNGARWKESSSGHPYADFYDRIRREAESVGGSPVSLEALEVLRRLSMPDARKGDITLVDHDLRGVTAVFDGVRPTSTGLAVDIGTTSIAAYLCDFHTGDILATAGILNPQQRFGEDVMSRIAFASREPDGLAQLNSLVVRSVNDVLDICLEKGGIDRKDVDEMTVVGNPTMQHIFAGLHPHSLGASPFIPFRRSPMNMRAVDTGCDLNPETNVYLFPVVSGFIGGDILGGVLSDRTYERDEITLIMDIGTNGELVLGNRSGLWATSCATGPALEGAHISCGMRASTGAIHAVTIDPAGLEISCRVFGEKDGALARGLCGSGLIDTVAAMVETGIILPSGALRSDLPDGLGSGDGGTRRVIIVPAEKSATDREISISAKDIRQVQLAKAALAAGIRLLKRRSGFSRIERVVLTGAFGTTFNPESASIVGMLPPETASGRLEVIPNAAGLGAVRALLNKNRRQEIESLYHNITALELAADPEFSTTFVEMIPFSQPSEKTAKGGT